MVFFLLLYQDETWVASAGAAQCFIGLCFHARRLVLVGLDGEDGTGAPGES